MIIEILLARVRIVVQLVESRRAIREKLVWTVELNKMSSVEKGNLVEIQYCVQLVRDGDDGMACESLSNDALHYLVCVGVDAMVMLESVRIGEYLRTYLLVASSRMSIVLGRSIARARQNSCF
jgi:hypothetical protein